MWLSPNSQHTLNTTHTARRLREFGLYCLRSALALVLIIGLNMMSFTFMAEKALAYYGDYETSAGNTFKAAMLDFDIQNNERGGFLGIEADGDIDDFSSVVTQHPDSLDVQYKVGTELADGSQGFCSTLDFHLDHTGTDFSYARISDLGLNTNKSLLTLKRSTTTSMGTWEFKDIDATNAAAQYPHGTECAVDFVFTGWRSSIDTPQESGYTDEERISLRLKNRMIVMNEFLPNPDPNAHGLDFGNDADEQPNGEWIELYNNSLHDYDISGWYIEDAAGNTVDVTAANTNPATTTVPARGWLVVYMSGSTLNNTGDTIMLKNGSDVIIDKYTYNGSDYCQKDPTPNATNTPTASGSCNEVPPNKSYARIPDGSGAWVDPIPTPGEKNKKDKLAVNTQPQVKGVSDKQNATSTESATSTKETTEQNKDSNTSTSTATSTDTAKNHTEPADKQDVQEQQSTSTDSTTNTTSTSTTDTPEKNGSSSPSEQSPESTTEKEDEKTKDTEQASSSQATSSEAVSDTKDSEADNTTASTTTAVESEDKAASSSPSTPKQEEGKQADNSGDGENTDGSANQPTQKDKKESDKQTDSKKRDNSESQPDNSSNETTPANESIESEEKTNPERQKESDNIDEGESGGSQDDSENTKEESNQSDSSQNSTEKSSTPQDKEKSNTEDINSTPENDAKTSDEKSGQSKSNNTNYGGDNSGESAKKQSDSSDESSSEKNTSTTSNESSKSLESSSKQGGSGQDGGSNNQSQNNG